MAPPSKRETAKVLFATLVGTMDNNALIPVITFYALALGADPLMAGLIVGAYSFVHIPANIVFGRLADRIGRKRPLVYGLLWDAVSLALYAVASSPVALLLVRLSHGLGGGFVGPASMALVSDRADPARKGRAFALYGISIAVAVILGFAFAGIASARNALRPMFFGLSFALWAGAVVASRIRETRAAGGVPAFDLSAFLRFLRYRGAVGGYTAIFALYFLLGALIVLAPLEFAAPHPIALTASTFAISLLVFAIVSVIVHYPSGILSDRLGPHVPCAAGLIAVSAAMALLPGATSFGTLLALMAVFGLGHGLIFPSSSALATRHARRDSLGLATGVYYALLVTGVALGAPLAGAIAIGWTAATGFLVCAAVSVIVLALLIPAALAAREGLRSPD
jgi:MFS family permease